MITIKRNGQFTVPAGDAFIGYAGDNLNVTKEFLVEGVTDISLIYRMYLLFDDGTSNYFLLDSEVLANGTKLTWNVRSEQIYKSGIVRMQIKASNGSGMVFHSETTPIIVQTAIEFSDVYSDKPNSEYLQHEQFLTALAETSRQLNEQTVEIKEQVESLLIIDTSKLANNAVTRQKLSTELQGILNDYEQHIFMAVVDLGTQSLRTAFDEARFTDNGVKYVFTCTGLLCPLFSVETGTAGELNCVGSYQIVSFPTVSDKWIRKVNSVAPSFSADQWQRVGGNLEPRVTALEAVIETLNSRLEAALS